MVGASQPEPGRARKRRGRFLAVLLGLSLCAAPFGGWIYWEGAYVEGQETCSQCGLHRDVDRRGPFWFRSQPYASRATPEPITACAEHVWVEDGCWREGGAWIYRLPVVVNR